MKNYLLFFLALSFAFGILIANHFSFPYFYLELSLIFISLWAFFIRKTKIFICFIFLGFLFLGMLNYKVYNKITPDHYSNFIKNQKNVIVKLKISKLQKENSNYATYQAKILSLFEKGNLKKVKGTILLDFLKDEEYKILLENSEIWAFGNFYEIKENLSFLSFNYKKYLAKKRIYHKFFVKKQKWRIQKTPTGISYKIQIFKSQLLEKLSKIGFSNSELSVFEALFFGEKSQIDSYLREVYAKSGAMHFLAISGFHIGITFSIFFFLFYGFIFFPFGKESRILAALAFMWAFVFFVGFSPSATRAALMLSFYSIFNLLKKSFLPYHILSLSAFVLLFFNPNYLFDVGFQLSYLAVFFIFYFQKVFKSRKNKKLVSYFLNSFFLSLSAQLGTFPLVLHYFGILSLFSFFSTLFLTPLLFFILGLGIIMIILEAFGFFVLGGWKLIEKMIFLMNHFLNFISSFQPKLFNNLFICAPLVLIFYLGILFLKPALLYLKKTVFLKLE